jgi:outer membrane protein assembly factor BamA
MRVRALLLAAAAAVVPTLAGAQTPPVRVVPIEPPPPAETEAQTPALARPSDLSALAGRPISRIVVALEGNVWDDVRAPLVDSLKVGDALTPAGARRALDELLRTGRFARGQVSAVPEGPGVAVVLRVAPRKLVESLDVDLHQARLDRDELLRDAGLAEGGEIVGADLDVLRHRLERNFALHGYPSASAAIRTRDADDPLHTLVTVDVTPGPPRRIDRINFHVAGAPPDRVLRATRGYGVSAEDRADEPAIAKADDALAEALRSQGWFRAQVSHTLAWVGPAIGGGLVILDVQVVTGPEIVPRFEGNDSYDADALTAALALDSETDRTPSHLADKIRGFYERRGFLDATVTVETRGDAGAPVQALVFHVTERARVRVTGRRYPCLSIEAIRRLSEGGPRSPGDVGREIDSYLEEELPGSDLLVNPDARGVSQTIGSGSGQVATGARPTPAELSPDDSYVEGTYERAAEHVRALYRSEGFLHAQVGPVQVVRARCDPRSPPGRCVPLPLPPVQEDVCTYDPAGLPLPVQPLDPALSCHPDPAHGVACAPTVDLYIPIKLGPRTRLWDVAFTGVRSVDEKEVGGAAAVPLGEPASDAKLEDASRRIADWYRERGYAYVDVKYALEPSPDSTRARVRFDVVEGEQVIVKAILVHGMDKTRESVIRRRIALVVGQPYRASLIRKTQERIATLGVFSTIQVSLADPYVQQAEKSVLVEVTEQTPQYIEIRPGFSTGEGVRGAIEYGHRNLLGYAWGLTVRLQASYLPDFLILDPGFSANYAGVTGLDRVATRDTITMSWPEMGLGPSIRSQVDAVYVRDLERDFTLFKGSALGTLIWRPVREVQISGGPDYERNDVHVFPLQSGAQQATIDQLLSTNQDPELARLLRVPDGDSNVVAGRIVLTWDRRDNAFNAHSGTYFAAGVEDVNSYPVQGTSPDPTRQFEGHFLRLTQTLAGYLPITRAIALAVELRLGEVVNVQSCSTPFSTGQTEPKYCTYPDRQFFMGGVDSMRGWLQDSFIPQELADQIAAGKLPCTDQSNCYIGVRGGNLMVNPRVELRFPVHPPFEGAIFGDFGNLWTDPSDAFDGRFTLRADVGAGVRVDTPVGPLVFDYGVNVTRRSYQNLAHQSYEDFGAFHFAIGLF